MSQMPFREETNTLSSQLQHDLSLSCCSATSVSLIDFSFLCFGVRHNGVVPFYRSEVLMKVIKSLLLFKKVTQRTYSVIIYSSFQHREQLLPCRIFNLSAGDINISQSSFIQSFLGFSMYSHILNTFVKSCWQWGMPPLTNWTVFFLFQMKSVCIKVLFVNSVSALFIYCAKQSLLLFAYDQCLISWI